SRSPSFVTARSPLAKSCSCRCRSTTASSTATSAPRSPTTSSAGSWNPTPCSSKCPDRALVGSQGHTPNGDVLLRSREIVAELATRAVIVCGGLLLVTTMLVEAACATRRPVELEPRYIAVHNTLAATGMVQVGPIQQGTLAEGREVRLPI